MLYSSVSPTAKFSSLQNEQKIHLKIVSKNYLHTFLQHDVTNNIIN